MTAAEQSETPAASAGMHANMAKFAASKAGDQAMDAAMKTLGGNAFSEDFAVVRFHNWTRFTRTAHVSNEMVLNHLAETLLGLPKSYLSEISGPRQESR